jgi:hypothetical protein
MLVYNNSVELNILNILATLRRIDDTCKLLEVFPPIPLELSFFRNLDYLRTWGCKLPTSTDTGDMSGGCRLFNDGSLCNMSLGVGFHFKMEDDSRMYGGLVYTGPKVNDDYTLAKDSMNIKDGATMGRWGYSVHT